MKTINQPNFCRHWCNSDYDEIIREQEKECENIVACSCSENGMNPDAFAAQGLMMKTQEDLFVEALRNFSRQMNYSFTAYNQGMKQKLSFDDWFEKKGRNYIDAMRNQL